MAVYVWKMYSAGVSLETGKPFPTCMWCAFKSGSDAAILNMAIGKTMRNRDINATNFSKENAVGGSFNSNPRPAQVIPFQIQKEQKPQIQNGKVQTQKENSQPASMFLFKPLLEEKPQHSFYRPAA